MQNNISLREENLAISREVTFLFALWPSKSISGDLCQCYTGENKKECTHKAVSAGCVCNTTQTLASTWFVEYFYYIHNSVKE